MKIACPLCGGEHEVTGNRIACRGRRRGREDGSDVPATLENLVAAAKRTRWELTFLSQVTATDLPAPVREFRFHPVRRWRFDFAWPDVLIAVEVEGLSLAGGRHQRIGGAIEDISKYAEAMIRGWRVLRVAQPHVKSGEAILWLSTLFAFVRAASLMAPETGSTSLGFRDDVRPSVPPDVALRDA